MEIVLRWSDEQRIVIEQSIAPHEHTSVLDFAGCEPALDVAVIHRGLVRGRADFKLIWDIVRQDAVGQRRVATTGAKPTTEKTQATGSRVSGKRAVGHGPIAPSLHPAAIAGSVPAERAVGHGRDSGAHSAAAKPGRVAAERAVGHD